MWRGRDERERGETLWKKKGGGGRESERDKSRLTKNWKKSLQRKA